MKNLNTLLEQNEENVVRKPRTDTQRLRKEGDELTALKITKTAYEKAFAYAKLVCDVSKDEATEIVGYLITPKDCEDRIARDCYLVKDQIAGPSEIKIEPQEIMRAGREIDKMDCKVLGWWHSHGDLETFHSPIDERNQMIILNAIAPVNYITENIKRNIQDLAIERKAQKVVLYDKRNPKLKYKLSLDKNSELSLAKLEIEEESRIGFAYSLVVHGTQLRIRERKEEELFGQFIKGKQIFQQPTFIERHVSRERAPYAEIATRKYCEFCRETQDRSEQVGIELYNLDSIEVDEDRIKKEVKAKLRFVQREKFPQIPFSKMRGDFEREEFNPSDLTKYIPYMGEWP